MLMYTLVHVADYSTLKNYYGIEMLCRTKIKFTVAKIVHACNHILLPT